jgi:organic hydroperoxide reductase OsmC/OhrA
LGKPNIVVGSPPEFKGEPDIWAPEELLVGSVNTCMMLTFLTLARAKGLTPVGYESEADGLLENIEGKYRITKITVRPLVSLKGKAELELAREIMENVEAQCFIRLCRDRKRDQSSSRGKSARNVAPFCGPPYYGSREPAMEAARIP